MNQRSALSRESRSAWCPEPRELGSADESVLVAGLIPGAVSWAVGVTPAAVAVVPDVVGVALALGAVFDAEVSSGIAEADGGWI